MNREALRVCGVVTSQGPGRFDEGKRNQGPEMWWLAKALGFKMGTKDLGQDDVPRP